MANTKGAINYRSVLLRSNDADIVQQALENDLERGDEVVVSDHGSTGKTASFAPPRDKKAWGRYANERTLTSLRSAVAEGSAKKDAIVKPRGPVLC